jgi:hypothetical protein
LQGASRAPPATARLPGNPRRESPPSARRSHSLVSLLHDAGIGYREAPSREQIRTTDADERVVSGDPVRVDVGVPVDREAVTFTLDGDLEVVEYG